MPSDIQCNITRHVWFIATIGRFSQRAAHIVVRFSGCPVTLSGVDSELDGVRSPRIWLYKSQGMMSLGQRTIPESFRRVLARKPIHRSKTRVWWKVDFQNEQNRPKSIKIPKFRVSPPGSLLQLCWSIGDTGNTFLLNSEHFASGIAIVLASEKELSCFP